MNRLKIVAGLVVVMLAVGFSLSGCRTAEGAGRDIERAGEAIQEEAREDRL